MLHIIIINFSPAAYDPQFYTPHLLSKVFSSACSYSQLPMRKRCLSEIKDILKKNALSYWKTAWFSKKLREKTKCFILFLSYKPSMICSSFIIHTKMT